METTRNCKLFDGWGAFERALARSKTTQRIVPKEDILRSLEEVPRTMKILRPLTDFYCEINNDDDGFNPSTLPSIQHHTCNQWDWGRVGISHENFEHLICPLSVNKNMTFSQYDLNFGNETSQAILLALFQFEGKNFEKLGIVRWSVRLKTEQRTIIISILK